MYAYFDEERENVYHALPDLEVFYADENLCTDWNEYAEEGTEYTPGFYWWPCYPGCLPDGEPSGPFETEEEALENARDF